jgi:hypothetical protein
MLTALRWIVQIAALRPVIQWRRCAKAWRNVILLDHPTRKAAPTAADVGDPMLLQDRTL